jgi:hypothetical protein
MFNSARPDWQQFGLFDSQGWALLVLGLATWRVTSLLVEEGGPWNLLGRLRHRLGVRYDEASRAYGLNVLSEALTCAWCLSLWTGAGWTIFWLATGRLALWVALPFCLSAAAVVVQRLVGKE